MGLGGIGFPAPIGADTPDVSGPGCGNGIENGPRADDDFGAAFMPGMFPMFIPGMSFMFMPGVAERAGDAVPIFIPGMSPMFMPSMFSMFVPAAASIVMPGILPIAIPI